MRLTPKQKEIMETVKTEGVFTAIESHNGRCVRGIRDVATGLKLVELGLLQHTMDRIPNMQGYSDHYRFTLAKVAAK